MIFAGYKEFVMLYSDDVFKRVSELGGSIEVICGSMFSGKTEELIRRLRRAQIARLKVEIFKPRTDNRFHDSDIVSHDANSIHSTPVDNSSAILLLGSDVQVVGIDEAHFLSEHRPNVCNILPNRGLRVIVATLGKYIANIGQFFIKKLGLVN